MLNASYEPINVCTVRRAAVLVLKDRAEILEQGEWALHAETLTLPRPAVIRLKTYVRIPRDAHRRKITRRAVFARDRWTCQYCGQERGNLTVDHVIPRSKGGGSGWENIVTCCAPCNRRKGDRLPRQANMVPRRNSEGTHRHDLHPRGRAGDPTGVGAVPRRSLSRCRTTQTEAPATQSDLRALRRWVLVAGVWAVAATAVGLIALLDTSGDDASERAGNAEASVEQTERELDKRMDELEGQLDDLPQSADVSKPPTGWRRSRRTPRRPPRTPSRPTRP